MKQTLETPEESLVRIFVNGDLVSALLCTPRDLKELAVGWLYTQGVVDSLEEVLSVGACEGLRDIHVRIVGDGHKERPRDRLIRTSACMAGEISYEQFLARPQAASSKGTTASLSGLKFLMRKALSTASSYRATGGIHCACVVSIEDRALLCSFEDVGRHNAVDKAIGRMLLERRTPTGAEALLTSGRLSSEMVLKTARIGIPILASITTGTDLAVRIARECGLTLIGRLLSDRPLIWCGGHRIVP